MSSELIQKRFLLTTSYNITEEGIQVHEKGYKNETSYLIPFEDISNKPFRYRSFQPAGIYLSILCISCAVILSIGYYNIGQLSIDILLFALAISAAPPILTWLTRKDIAGFGDLKQGFMLHGSKPSSQAVQNFLEHVQSNKKSYLRKRYVHQQAPNRSKAEKLQVLNWLHSEGVISDEELEQQKQFAEQILEKTA